MDDDLIMFWTNVSKFLPYLRISIKNNKNIDKIITLNHKKIRRLRENLQYCVDRYSNFCAVVCRKEKKQ